MLAHHGVGPPSDMGYSGSMAQKSAALILNAGGENRASPKLQLAVGSAIRQMLNCLSSGLRVALEADDGTGN